MNDQILMTLKRKLNELSAYGEVGAETLRNALKEELQFYVLNFIYHHPDYSNWIMYGGSALRICHGLDRMSVDLDFETTSPITNEYLEDLKKEVEGYFPGVYGTRPDFLTAKTVTGRGMLFKFHVGEDLGLGTASKQVHVKIDLNNFTVPKAVTERRPINRNQLSFVITTYNMSALMASKIAAIFLRGTRGVGKAVYEEKGRDVYDLLWYMGKKVIPDTDYLVAKGVSLKDPKALFDKLTVQMNKVNDANLKQDLIPLFIDRKYIENWLKSWRESYLGLLDDYKINTVTTLVNVGVHEDFPTGNFSFVYAYNTEASGKLQVVYTMSDYWLDLRDEDLPAGTDSDLEGKIVFLGNGWGNKPALQDKLKRYASLFYGKTEGYFKKTNRVVLGERITTKVIRMTADNLNQKEQIVLNKSALFSCELEDLLK